MHGVERVIVLGMGGGGDVAGALAAAAPLRALGLETLLGGVAWERLPIDPRPGPRPFDEVLDAEPLAPHVALAGPTTRTADGALFAEANMARFLGQPTLLVDILAGPRALATGLSSAAERLGAQLIACVDVGGDVLGDGSEPGLASPLCDAVMLAAAVELARGGTRAVGAVFGPGCDGELTVPEVLDRLAALAGAGGLLGASGMAPDVIDELERAVQVVPTEASAQAIRCARGETGWATIRRGRRRLFLSPVGAISFYFDPEVAYETVARLARAVSSAQTLEEANRSLNELGVRTELDFERSAAKDASR